MIDATGTYGNANHLGGDGNEASGEHEAADLIQYDLPDILGADRGRYAGRMRYLSGAAIRRQPPSSRWRRSPRKQWEPG